MSNGNSVVDLARALDTRVPVGNGPDWNRLVRYTVTFNRPGGGEDQNACAKSPLQEFSG